MEASNNLYDSTCKIANLLMARGILWSMENPRNSIFWWYPGIFELTQLPEVKFSIFQSCAWGASRPKWTGWLHFPGSAFDELEKV